MSRCRAVCCGQGPKPESVDEAFAPQTSLAISDGGWSGTARASGKVVGGGVVSGADNA